MRCINEFVVHADAYVDLHGGDIPEALVPFVICRAGNDEVAKKSKAIAMAFGLPYVLTVSKPVQPSKGHRAGAGGLSSYAAAADKGIPAILAEAGGAGQMQEEAVALLVNGVVNVMRHLGMIEGCQRSNLKSRIAETNSKPKPKKTARSAVATAKTSAADTAASTVLTKFEWLYTKSTGVWYPKVAQGDAVREGEQIGTVGDLFGDTLEEIVSPVNGVVLFSDDQSIRAREWITYGNRSGIKVTSRSEPTGIVSERQLKCRTHPLFRQALFFLRFCFESLAVAAYPLQPDSLNNPKLFFGRSRWAAHLCGL